MPAVLDGADTSIVLVSQLWKHTDHARRLRSVKALHDSFSLRGFAVSQESLQGVQGPCRADLFHRQPQPMKQAKVKQQGPWGCIKLQTSFSSRSSCSLALKRQPS